MSRRTTIILAVVAAATVAAAAVATFSGGSSESPEHRAVAAYIEDVDAIQSGLTLQLARVRAAYRDFGKTAKGGAGVARRLASAELTLATLERRLVALDAPAPAAKLKRLLVQLATVEVGLAHEVHGLAVFMPAFGAAVAASRDASRKLARDLAAVKHPQPHVVRGTPKQIAKAKADYAARAAAAAAAQADALDVYAAALSLAIRSLRALDPPAVMAPAYGAQLRSLVATRSAGAALARELRRATRTRVAELNRRLAEATRIAVGVDAQKAQIAAIEAYNRSVRKTQTLQLAIRDELGRVQTAVG